MQRARLPYLFIPLAAFLATLPLLIQGCSCGHDFDFHLLSWMEAARQFTHGDLHPHWAYTAAYNAGEPRFVFYPPLSWHLGALLGLLFPWTWTPILYTWLALTASGLALHRLARDFTTPAAALIAAILYTVNPYMLFTAYERTAYAELLAAAWIPLLLQAILRSDEEGGVTIPRIAIPIALLWLTNAPAAVMSCYALALIAAIRVLVSPDRVQTKEPSSHTPPKTVISTEAARAFASSEVEKSAFFPLSPVAPHLDSEMGTSRGSATAPAHAQITHAPSQTPLQLALNTIIGTILGLGLAAFYILPAAYERRYVQIAMAIIPNMRVTDNFLFHHTGDPAHDQVLHTASLIAVILITLTVATLLFLIATKQGASPLDSEMGASREPGSPTSAFARRGGEARPAYSHSLDTSSVTRSSQHEHTKPIPAYLPTSLLILTIAITLLLTPFTTILWTHAPELAFLQFPWRLTAIVAAILAFAIALALSRLNLKPISAAAFTLVVAAALTCPAYTVFHQSCDQEDTVPARLALFQSNQGAEPTDEYTPINADNDSLTPADPPYWLSPDPNAKAPTHTSPGPAPTHLTVQAPAPEDIILNLRDYPAWKITLNGTDVTDHLQRDDGLVAFPIPAGSSTINITNTHTLDETLGDILSLASLVLLVLLLLANRGKKMI